MIRWEIILTLSVEGLAPVSVGQEAQGGADSVLKGGEWVMGNTLNDYYFRETEIDPFGPVSQP